ncbi:putative ribosome biogenesis GTPase RsgA [Sporosarcina sp. NCCP-2222]|uniref:ribosome small subunit-dependent GTPase A n=1 Tax=Sporosarcina sp. NCCP-2222 TaxID=2935073 RepID=UPI0020822591|nr:ribosome small subunit-dependent GTPase A [Sporosarcina sp. NCCP-2222]GKV57102.1 putative ribosome biogenesis GTPase RsgA [Sporosarcina sp. NCCP-2222]
MTNLQQLGWTELREQDWSALPEGMKQKSLPGRVTLEHKRMYRVITEEGEWLSVCSGTMEHMASERRDFPAVGDWVAVEKMPGEQRGIIHSLLPRTSLFSRKSAGMTITEQIIATNVDIVFLVMSLNQDFNERRLERYLIASYDSGALPVILLTKKDLCAEPDVFIEKAQWIAPGTDIITVSNHTREGLDEVQAILQNGKTAALLGSSGVGKSSLTNALLEDGKMEIQDIREDDAKGRHTTTHREMLLLPSGGILIDTPGMREFQLWDQGDSLDTSFQDIDQLAHSCKFSDCQHKKEPGCAVQTAIAEGILPAERYDSYLKLQKELAFLERKLKQSEAKERKTQKKATHKKR